MKYLPFPLLAAGIFLVVGLSACGNKAGDRPPNLKAFDSAAPEIKEMWTAAREADRTNDYYRAEVLLYEMIRRDLPPDQVQAARNQLVITHHRMQDAVEKGDPVAKAALDQMRMAPPNRPPRAAQ